MMANDQVHNPATLTPGRKPPTAADRRLCGPHSPSGHGGIGKVPAEIKILVAQSIPIHLLSESTWFKKLWLQVKF
jgi:hypothetical protein